MKRVLPLFFFVALGCGTGLQRAQALCHNVTCESPGPPACLENGMLRVYRTAGRCDLSTGQCEYASDESQCPLGCYEGDGVARCRREGDLLWRSPIQSWVWALRTDNEVLVATKGRSSGCTHSSVLVRRFLPAVFTELSPFWVGCVDLGALESPLWPPIVTITLGNALVIPWEGRSTSGVFTISPDGGETHLIPFEGQSLAADIGEGFFLASRSKVAGFSIDGGLVWEVPCTVNCSTSHAAAVIPGRAYVSCNEQGCQAFRPSDGGLLFAVKRKWVRLLLADNSGRVVIGSQTIGSQVGGIEAFELDGGLSAQWPAPHAMLPQFRVNAAVVEQGGTLLVSWWESDGVVVRSALSRLEASSLDEIARLPVACEPGALAARKDGSLLVLARCIDSQADTGGAVFAIAHDFSPLWRAEAPNYYAMQLGELAIGSEGQIAVEFGGVLHVLLGTQKPAESAWPMRAADAQFSFRARLP